MKNYVAAAIFALIGASIQAEVLESTLNIVPLVESDTDAEYHKHEILGFSVHIASKDASDHPELSESMLWHVRSQLQRMVEVLPMDKLKLLRQVDIWLNNDSDEDDEICRGACYVPEGYRGVDFFEDRAGSVIIRDMEFSIQAAWCCTKSTVLHELAHAYHDQFIEDGFYNDEIDDEYEDAKDSGDYDDVQVLYPWWEDQYVEHYGMTNASEFFASMTETFFLGAYHSFPHNIRDLFEYDRDVYNLMFNAWYSDVEDGEVSFSEATVVEVSAHPPQP